MLIVLIVIVVVLVMLIVIGVLLVVLALLVLIVSDSSDRSDRSDSNYNKLSSSIVTTSVRLKITAILLSINCCNTPFCSILSLGRCIASILSVIHEECRPYQ